MLGNERNSRVVWLLTAVSYAVLFLYPVIPYGAAITSALAGAVFLLTGMEERSGFFRKVTLYHGYMLLFTAFCFLSGLWAWDAGKSIEMGFSLLKSTIVIFLLFSYYQRHPDINALLKAIMWGGYLACAVVAFLYDPVKMIMILVTGRRIDNTILNANTLGLIAAVTAIVHLHYILQNKKLHWPDSLLLFAVFMVAISGSKKALLFLVGGYFLLFTMKSLDSKNAGKSLLISLTVLAAVTVMMLMLPMFSHLRIRIAEMIRGLLGKGHSNASTNLRMNYIRLGLAQFIKTPLLGIGMDCSSILLEAEMGRSTYLHCNYVELLVCGGITGAVLFYSIYGYFLYHFWKFRKNRDKNYSVFFVLTVLLLVTDIAMVSYYSKETFFYSMVLFTYIQSLKKEKSTRD